MPEPQEGDVRQQDVGGFLGIGAEKEWQVFLEGEWLSWEDIDWEATLPEGYVAANIDPRGPTLIFKTEDGAWVDLEGNVVQEAPPPADEQAGEPPRPEGLPAGQPWPPTKVETDEDGERVRVIDWREVERLQEKYGAVEEVPDLDAPQFYTDPDTGDRFYKAKAGGEWKPYTPPKKEQLEEPQGEAGFVQGPGGQTFIRQPNGTLTPYNLPAAPRLTLDQEIDRLLVDWASGSPTGAKSLSQAHALDSQRDLIEAQRGLSYPDAVQLAISQAKTPEEARHWIDVLTNPFADPYAPSQDLLAADYTQSVQAGQAEPDPLVTAYVDNTYGFVTEGVGKTPDQAKYAPKGQQPFPATGLFGASMEDIIGASGIKDPFTGKSYPIFKQPQVQRPYGQEDDLFAAAPPTSVKKSNLDPREDEEGPVSPFPTTQPKVQQPYGEEDSLSFAAASPQSGVLDEIAAKGGVTAGGIAIYNPQTGDIKFSSADQEEDLLKAYPGYQVAAKGPPKPKTPQAAIQGTAGLLNPFTKPQPGNNPMYSPKTGDGLLNPFESTLYTIEQRRRQKKKQSDFERSAPLTARFS